MDVSFEPLMDAVNNERLHQDMSESDDEKVQRRSDRDSGHVEVSLQSATAVEGIMPEPKERTETSSGENSKASSD